MNDDFDTHDYRVAVSRMVLDHKLPQGDPAWHAFNGSFRNCTLPIYSLMESVYEGRAITTWHRDGWRKSANYDCGQHLAIDLDTEDEKSTLPYLRTITFVNRFAAFTHTTISHTPERPRARVYFVLDTPIVQPKNYVLATSALLWSFGGAADRKCSDPCRFYYGAPRCDLDPIGKVLPLERVKALIDEYKETGLRARQRHEHPEPWRNVRADMAEVESALRCIPPWGIDYDEWLSILMALHAEFGTDALSLAEDWADGEPGEVMRKFRSFSASGNQQGAVTIATLFKIAQDRFHWERPKRKEERR